MNTWGCLRGAVIGGFWTVGSNVCNGEGCDHGQVNIGNFGMRQRE